MALILKGRLEAKKVGTYDNRDYAVLQCIERDERNTLKLIEVSLPEGADHAAYVEGKMIEVAVSVSSSKTGKIYYRAILPTPAAPI